MGYKLINFNGLSFGRHCDAFFTQVAYFRACKYEVTVISALKHVEMTSRVELAVMSTQPGHLHRSIGLI